MHILFRVLHHRPCLSSPKALLKLKTMEEVARVTDKYDCVTAMSLWSQKVHRVQIRNNKHSISRLIFSTYAFQDSYLFQILTRNIVYRSNNSTRSAKSSILDIIPSDIGDQIFGKMVSRFELSFSHVNRFRTETLNMHRCNIKRLLNLQLERIILPVVRKPLYLTDDDRIFRDNSVHFSYCDTYQVGFFINALCTEHLWPITTAFEDCSIDEICNRLENCNFVALTKTAGYGTRCSKCSSESSIKAIIKGMVKKARGIFKGLCLNCVKNHETCKSQHTKFHGLMNDRNIKKETKII